MSAAFASGAGSAGLRSRIAFGPSASTSRHKLRSARGFTLIELLIVVAIIAILAAIAVPNFLEATRRTQASACAANLKAIATGLVSYRIDWNILPLSDGVAGEHDSRTHTDYGHGPAGNGLWNGIPNALVTLKYVNDRRTLFCPVHWKKGGARLESLRYAYNAGSHDTNAFVGGDGVPIDGRGASGQKQWVCRCLFINSHTFARARYVVFPHGDAPDASKNYWGEENVLWSDMGVTREPGRVP